MKTARTVTLIGSIVLLVAGCMHGIGYIKLLEGLKTEQLAPETANILKTCWLSFSVELIALAVIAFIARSLERGGGVVLLCALANAANGWLMLHFLGPFIGVYLVTIVMLLFLAGGLQQVKSTTATR
jgi:peptidoglycan/LPS O-acetylase OafA/YrhL